MAVRNKISQQVDPATIITAKTKVGELAGLFPYRISQTEDERKGGLKIGYKVLGWLDLVITYMDQNSNLIPNYLDKAEADKDYTGQKAIFEVVHAAQPVVQSLEDTATLMAQESLQAALLFYNAVKMAAKQGVPGARDIYDDLKRRFPGGKPPDSTPENPDTKQ
jgi:hypothetical protein